MKEAASAWRGNIKLRQWFLLLCQEGRSINNTTPALALVLASSLSCTQTRALHGSLARQIRNINAIKSFQVQPALHQDFDRANRTAVGVKVFKIPVK